MEAKWEDEDAKEEESLLKGLPDGSSSHNGYVGTAPSNASSEAIEGPLFLEKKSSITEDPLMGSFVTSSAVSAEDISFDFLKDAEDAVNKMRLALEQEQIPDYSGMFDEIVNREKMGVGLLNRSELERLREEEISERLREAEERARLHMQRLERVKVAEREAHARLNSIRNDVQRTLQRTAEDIKVKIASREAAVFRGYQKAFEVLRKRIERYQAIVRVKYGHLRVDERNAAVLSRRIQVDWRGMPQPIEFRIHKLSSLKNKVPDGMFVLTVTLYDRLGGDPLRWSQLPAGTGVPSSGANSHPSIKDGDALSPMMDDRPSATTPTRHRGRFYDLDLTFNQCIFGTAPSATTINPSHVFIFELFLLGNREVPVDRVIAWGALPICTTDFTLAVGKYKIPMLRGEVDSGIEKYSTIESKISEDLDNWLANLYVESVSLPRSAWISAVKSQKVEKTNALLNFSSTTSSQIRSKKHKLTEWDVELAHSTAKLRVRGKGAGRKPVALPVEASKPQNMPLSNTRKGGVSFANSLEEDELIAADSVSIDSEMSDVEYVSSSDEGDFEFDEEEDEEGMLMSSLALKEGERPLLGISGAPVIEKLRNVKGPLYLGNTKPLNVFSNMPVTSLGEASRRVNSEIRSGIRGIQRSADLGVSGLKWGPSTLTPQVASRRVDGLTWDFSRPGSHAAGASGGPAGSSVANRLDEKLQQAAVAAQNSLSSGTSVHPDANEEFTFAVRKDTEKQIFGVRYRQSLQKLRFFFQELSTEFINGSWKSQNVVISFFQILTTFWTRIYIHYLGQYVLLRFMRVPVYAFDPLWYSMVLKYVSAAIPNEIEVAVVLMGPLSVLIMFSCLILIAYVSQRTFGSFSPVLSRFVAYFGLASVLDSALIAAIDAAAGRFDCVSRNSYCADSMVDWRCTCSEGDAWRLGIKYAASESERTSVLGIVITVLVYLLISGLSLLFLYLYMLYLHRNGQMIDTYRRLEGLNDRFILPADLEVSAEELLSECEKSTRWRGPNGAVRRIVVAEYVVTDPQDPHFEEKVNHIVIYTVDGINQVQTAFMKPSQGLGKRSIFRQFLRYHDGSILEVFGAVEPFLRWKVKSIDQEIVFDKKIL